MLFVVKANACFRFSSFGAVLPQVGDSGAPRGSYDEACAPRVLGQDVVPTPKLPKP